MSHPPLRRSERPVVYVRQRFCCPLSLVSWYMIAKMLRRAFALLAMSLLLVAAPLVSQERAVPASPATPSSCLANTQSFLSARMKEVPPPMTSDKYQALQQEKAEFARACIARIALDTLPAGQLAPLAELYIEASQPELADKAIDARARRDGRRPGPAGHGAGHRDAAGDAAAEVRRTQREEPRSTSTRSTPSPSRSLARRLKGTGCSTATTAPTTSTRAFSSTRRRSSSSASA